MITQQNLYSFAKTQVFKQMAEDRLYIYQFLSTNYCQALNRETVEQLLSKNTIHQLSQVLMMREIDSMVAEGLGLINQFIVESSQKEIKEVQTALSVEYTRLIRGLQQGYGPVPPYESIYRGNNRQPSKDILRQIHSFYDQLGVFYDLKDQPDFIGLEIDLMRYLIEKEMMAWENCEADGAIGYLMKQWEFLNQHLLCWIPKFCGSMLDQAKLKFYKGIALITMGCLNDDFHQLREQLVEVSPNF